MRTYGLGLIGSDRRTAAIAARLGPGSPYAYGALTLAAACGDDQWQGLLAREDVHAVYLGCPPESRAQIAAAALSTGKAVLSALPVAQTLDQLDAIEAVAGSAPLVITTDLRCTLAGRSALAMAADGTLGELHSIYLAQRWQAQAAGTVRPAWEFTERLWETVDYMVALGGGAALRVHAAGGDVRGQEVILFNARFPGDVIATVEVGAVLVPGCGVTDPEVEIDVAGNQNALRAEPYRHVVSVCGSGRNQDRGMDARVWHCDPAANMLVLLEEVLAGGGAGGPGAAIGLDQQRNVIATVRAIQETACAE